MTHSAFACGVCRATYAAEQSVQKLEKGKKDQDLLIDHLQQQLRTHEQQIAIYSQQYDAQKRETRAAKEMLAGAEAEMEGIHFEKKQLTAQWQSSLIATQRRDQALRVSMSIAQTKEGACLLSFSHDRSIVQGIPQWLPAGPAEAKALPREGASAQGWTPVHNSIGGCCLWDNMNTQLVVQHQQLEWPYTSHIRAKYLYTFIFSLYLFSEGAGGCNHRAA